MTSYKKVKSVSKITLPKGKILAEKVLSTMKDISTIVGSTLGPGGSQVLIERQEYGLPNLITKDGVTVFKALGFQDAVRHAIMEAARDAAVRTAQEAGDGTTTATILAEAIVRHTHEFCQAHPQYSPQRVVRELESLFKEHILPQIEQSVLTPNPTLLKQVATCSANGDTELATAIMKCFDLAGDDGNVTLTEKSGPSGYEVELLKGYPLNSGYEDACKRFYSVFVNDKTNQRVYLESPVFVLFFGSITDMSMILPLMHQIGSKFESGDSDAIKNVVLVAFDFSETVLGNLAANWTAADRGETIRVYPMVIPKSPIHSGLQNVLEDLAAVTGSKIFDALGNPMERGTLEQLGPKLDYFEASRYRSNVVGHSDSNAVINRVEELKAQLGQGSMLEETILKERIGKLSGGIAKLTISGPSTGEVREKRDRAEDAACAVRGAIKFGVLPGGGWMLLKLSDLLFNELADKGPATEILAKAFQEPVEVLLLNTGCTTNDIEHVMSEIINHDKVYDALRREFGTVEQLGVVDSMPAVAEAIRNSISIAALLGTLGGAIVFPRDEILERSEASAMVDLAGMQ
jgi:chaperonin GroEL